MLYLGLCGLLGVAAIATWWIEKQIVTDREQVEAATLDVIDAYHQQDRERTLERISDRAVELERLATVTIGLVRLGDDLRVSDLSVRMKAQNSRAVSHFRVNTTVSMTGYGEVGYRPSRWEVTWQKEGGKWRIIYVEQLDPITGEPQADWTQLTGRLP
ncbi:hypothetical protein Mal4_36110 [Maioricimonas rarisocia]|uniref:DUF4440 domain-containing protein n=1 Tax=Maioricimonas rarisocia TaxID=2528026 RepID=A0A517Z9V7_9PLAN|nr:hypothetical protein [Maioricimonas rarisocia]QDU39272.1 hypothetical protein Mal4_36110 [Maioricimonas rarisocia]